MFSASQQDVAVTWLHCCFVFWSHRLAFRLAERLL